MRKANVFDDAFIEAKTSPIPVTGCLIWMGGTVKGGYGKTSNDGRTVIAHRAIWEHRNGPIPKGMLLCHKCDVPSCVNPDHLFLGTHADNSDDMVSKARQAKGEKVSTAVLNPETVLAIRSTNGSRSSVARKFGISKSTVRQIVLGETWRDVA